MLDIIGTILAPMTLAVLLAAVVCTIPVRLTWRLALAAAGGAWVGVAIAVAASGGLAAPRGAGRPVCGSARCGRRPRFWIPGGALRNACDSRAAHYWA